MFPVIVHVRYFCSIEEKLKEVNHLIYADHLIDAATQIDNYYGTDIDEVKFEFLEEGYLIPFNNEVLEEIRKEIAY